MAHIPFQIQRRAETRFLSPHCAAQRHRRELGAWDIALLTTSGHQWSFVGLPCRRSCSQITSRSRTFFELRFDVKHMYIGRYVIRIHFVLVLRSSPVRARRFRFLRDQLRRCGRRVELMPFKEQGTLPAVRSLHSFFPT